jgi:hypothetical protein
LNCIGGSVKQKFHFFKEGSEQVFTAKNTAHYRAGKREETDKIKDEAPTLRAYGQKVGKHSSANNHAPC